MSIPTNPPTQSTEQATSLRRPHHVISTSSDEMLHDGSSTDSANEWSISNRKRRLKKKKNTDNTADIVPPTPPRTTTPTTTHNPFTSLPVDVPPTATAQNPTPPSPPPIFIKTVTDYALLRNDLNRLIGQNNYTTKSTMTGMTLKTSTPNAYRTTVTYLRDKNANFHTYQCPTDRPYRVAIRHLNPATPTNDIATALEEKGHRVRHVHNAIHPRLKVPLALFFVDLEPADNNKAIFNVTALLNSAIHVEEPYKRVDIPQCTNCQEYHHTKAYCHHPARCVKCGGRHETSTCSKTRDTPATCALCNGPHPANYKGCQVYQELQRKRRQQPVTSIKTKNNANPPLHPPPATATHFPTIASTPPSPPKPVFMHSSHVSSPAMSYAHVAALSDTNTVPQQLPTPTDHNNITSQRQPSSQNLKI